MNAPKLPRHSRPLLLALLFGAIITFSLAWIASWYAPIGPARSYMIVPGKPGWPVDGTVAVGVASGPVRTDLLLDPGPYTKAERGNGPILYPTPPVSALPLQRSSPFPAALPPITEQPAPGWIRDIALDQAGDRFKGWQARVAAFGWPLPVLYWLWDWRTESLSGGFIHKDPAKPTGGTTSTKVTVPEKAIPWRLLWWNFILDMLFFSIGAVVLILTFRLIRSRRRSRQEHCPHCNYPRQGLAPLAPCPECGTLALCSSGAK